MTVRKYRILVVDDDPSVLFTYQMILQQKGYDVVGASSPEDARRSVESSKFDLLLCDLSLGHNASGFDVIEHAQTCQPGLPALLLTGYAGREISDRAQRQGISLLLKPVDIQEFLNVVRVHLKNAQQRRAAGG